MDADPKSGPGTGLSTRLVVAGNIAAFVPLISAVLLAAWGNDSFLTKISLGQMVALFALTLGVGTLTGLVLSSRLSRQVRRLQRSLRLAGSGDFSRKLPVRRQDELSALYQEYNALMAHLTRLRAQQDETTRQVGLSLRHRTDELNALVVENTRLRAEAQQQVKSVSAIHEFSRTVTTSPGVGRICSQLFEALDAQLTFELAYVLLVDEAGRQMVPVAIVDKQKNLRLVGQYVKDLPKPQALPGRPMAQQVLRVGSTMRGGDAGDSDGTGRRRHLLGIPLRASNRTIGVLVLGVTAPRVFSKQDERIVLTLAEQTAMAIENSRLLEEAGKVETLREIDRLKSELISTISHELRTPLASIKGYISTLLRPDVAWSDETKAEFLQIIEEESDRLQALIDNLMQMSRIDAGMLRIERQPTQLDRMAQKVARKARARSPKHRFAVVFPTDMPDVLVDPTQIELVLNNLVDNAIKYSPSGRITVRGELSAGEIKVSVSDEGIGIRPQHIEQIFERFYRADTAEIKRISGTGLGLSICRGIVEAHGGRIWAESQPGEGSIFSFTLPAIPPSLDDDYAAAGTSGGGFREQEPK